MMNSRQSALTALVALVVAATPARGAVPALIPLQGQLADSDGVPIDGDTDIVFTLYDAQTAGQVLWTDTVTVDVQDGFFTIYLGEETALNVEALIASPELWLGFAVGSDAEMERVLLASVPFALAASVCENAVGHISPQSVSVNGNPVIDSDGNWVGNTAGLAGAQGPQGDKGDPGEAGAPGLACWDLNEDGSCDVGTEDTNGDASCSVADCFSQAYPDLFADGRLDFFDDGDLVTKGQADGTYATQTELTETQTTLSETQAALSAALARIANLEAAQQYPSDVVAFGSYLWQKTDDGIGKTWVAAGTYCNDLVLAGFDDWRLPTISELRSLIRGCPATMTGGACGGTDACLTQACWSSACSSCAVDAGPDAGNYWPTAIDGTAPVYWSSSTVDGFSYAAWFVSFSSGGVYHYDKGETETIRCVRGGP